MSAVIGYAPGAYDLFHVGHLNVLRQAREHCDVLVAGVVADEICELTKGVRPFVPLEERLDIVRSIGIVDAVHAETTPDKLDAWQEVRFDRIFKGDDWRGTAKGRDLEVRLGAVGVEVVYFPYTMHTSSTMLRRAVQSRGHDPAHGRPGTRLMQVDERGLALPASVRGVVTVAFDGRYVWSFQPARDAGPDGEVPWPPSLRPHLAGRTRLTLAEPGTGRTYVDREVVFGDRPEDRIRLEDAHGHPLAVNKVGNLTRVFAETDQASRTEILTGTARVLDDLREHGGVEAYLNYGCLLGAVREGRMIGTDCDADVCYLSEQTHPADVIRESYALERAMLDRGWPTVRMSGGDFKVLLRLARRPHLLRRRLRGVLLRGRVLPARQPQRRAPALRGDADLHDRPRGRRAARAGRPGGDAGLRLRPVLAGPGPVVQVHRPARGSAPPRRLAARLPRRPAGVERAVPRPPRRRDPEEEVRLRPLDGAPGAARRHDRGDRVRHRPGRRLLRAARSPGPGLRRVTGRPVADPEAAAQVGSHGRRTPADAGGAAHRGRDGRGDRDAPRPPPPLRAWACVNCVDDEGRRNLWRLARMALHGTDGKLFLEFSSTHAEAGLEPAGLARRVDADGVVAEIEAYGGRVERRLDRPGTDLFDRPDPSTCRLQVTFPRTGATTHA